MKTLSAFLATAVALVLVLSPLSSAAAGTVSFSSPTAGSSFKGTTTLSIAGTVSPAPAQTDSVYLTIRNPSGGPVWADLASVNPTTGAFTDTAPLGGSGYTATGTYTLSATDSFSAAGSITFQYTPSTSPQYNVTRALINIQGNLTIIQKEIKNLNNDLNGNVTAIKATQTSQTNAIAALQTSLNSLTSTVTGLVTSVGQINTAVGQVNTAVTALGPQITTAANNAQNAANAVSSTQTYVLVVAVLAAITLVLELAILVRKLS